MSVQGRVECARAPHLELPEEEACFSLDDGPVVEQPGVDLPEIWGAERGAVSVGVPWAVGTPDAKGDPPLSPPGRVLPMPWAQAAPLMTSCTGEPAAPGPSLLGVPEAGAASAAAGVSVLLLILLVLPPWFGRGFLTSQCGGGH